MRNAGLTLHQVNMTNTGTPAAVHILFNEPAYDWSISTISVRG